jgi:hypothetical protein
VVSSSISWLFGLLLLGHALHVVEEAWGRFWIAESLGMGAFWLINVVLWVGALVLFLQVRRGHRWAFIVALVYVAFMALQGVGHNVAWLVTGRYFGGFAGGLSGILMLAIGVPLWLRLWQSIPLSTGTLPEDR